MNNKKKLILCGVLAAVVLIVGTTAALLSFATDTKTNAFSSNKNISIKLREPTWDGYTFDDPAGDGLTAKTDSTALGVNQAKAYVPGQTIPKDPRVKNSGTEPNGVSTYVAIKVQYIIGGINYTYNDFSNALLEKNGLNFDTDHWTLIKDYGANGQIYMYGTNKTSGTVLNVTSETTPLFTQVPIKLTLQPDSTGLFPKFQIKVTAYGIQTDNVAASDASTQLLQFIGSN